MFRRRFAAVNANAPAKAARSPEVSGAIAAAPRPKDTSETRRAAQIDLFAGIGEAAERDLALRRILEDAFSLVNGMTAFSSEFGGIAETTLLRADQFVASLCNLQSQSDLIEDRLVTATDVVNEAHKRSSSALYTVEELTSVIGEVERVAEVIASIAARTNLLALNATIEAAHAGAASAGFGVVASEVKLLSQQTASATRDIIDLARRILSRTHNNMVEVKDFDRVIRSLQGVFATIRGAVEAQGKQTRDIATGSEEVASLAQTVKERAERLQQLGATVTSMTQATASAAEEARDASMRLTNRAMIVLGHGELDHQKTNSRWPVALAGALMLGGQTYQVRIIDLSEVAIRVETGPDFPASALGETVAVDLPELGVVSLRLLATATAGFETAIVEASPELRTRLARKVETLHLAYRPYIERVKNVASRVEQRVEQAIAAGTLTPETLFDTAYRREGETEPALYTTPAVAPLIAVTLDVLEAELDRQPTPEFCFLQDRNGFSPVHNVRYSQPRRLGDVIWNLRHSRMQRIFDDRVGMAAARNLRDFMVQSYARDMGDAIETLMEFDAPVFADNRHWGTIRMGFRLA